MPFLDHFQKRQAWRHFDFRDSLAVRRLTQHCLIKSTCKIALISPQSHLKYLLNICRLQNHFKIVSEPKKHFKTTSAPLQNHLNTFAKYLLNRIQNHFKIPKQLLDSHVKVTSTLPQKHPNISSTS